MTWASFKLSNFIPFIYQFYKIKERRVDFKPTSTMGPLQLVSHVVQKHLAGEQETHWNKTNKELTSSKMVIFFICLVPVHFLLTSKVFLYHVTDELQRAHLNGVSSCDTFYERSNCSNTKKYMINASSYFMFS